MIVITVLRGNRRFSGFGFRLMARQSVFLKRVDCRIRSVKCVRLVNYNCYVPGEGYNVPNALSMAVRIQMNCVTIARRRWAASVSHRRALIKLCDYCFRGRLDGGGDRCDGRARPEYAERFRRKPGLGEARALPIQPPKEMSPSNQSHLPYRQRGILGMSSGFAIASLLASLQRRSRPQIGVCCCSASSQPGHFADPSPTSVDPSRAQTPGSQNSSPATAGTRFRCIAPPASTSPVARNP